MTSSERITKRLEFMFRNVAVDCATVAMADPTTEDVKFETSPWVKEGDEGRYVVTIIYFKTTN